jgi:alanine-glyoxylate transaminase/(R)-3-amino-2-methylpropionate-pyruvate transaminase
VWFRPLWQQSEPPPPSLPPPNHPPQTSSPPNLTPSTHNSSYAEDVADTIRASTPGAVAAFISETIQGVGGATPLADGYLPEAYRMTREAGGICIADEVQTGFGRTGDAYWGFQLQGVTPDIVTMAKGIGNGLPLAAVVTTPEVAAALTRRVHFNT